MTPFVLLGALMKSSLFVGQPDGPRVIAEAAIVVHAESGRVLWGRNVDMPMYPASTTKLLTAMVLLEATSAEDVLVAPIGVEEIKGSSLHLKVGERITVEAALYALMIRSANDVGFAVAMQLDGSLEGFAARMQAYSDKLGMKNSTWFTPHGLNHPWHKTTARDMAKLGLAASKNEKLVRIAGTKKYTIQRDVNLEDTLLATRNELLESDSTLLGFKTGYTNPAGKCFVGYQETKIGRIVTVILNSTDYVADQKALSKWSGEVFKERDLGREIPPRMMVKNQAEESGIGIEAEKATAWLSDFDLSSMRVELPDLIAPVEAGQDLGAAKMILADGTRIDVPIRATTAMKAKVDYREWLKNPTMIGAIVLASIFFWHRRRIHDQINSH